MLHDQRRTLMRAGLEAQFKELLAEHGVTMHHFWTRRADRLWDADHRVPVAEGGGECGLDGYQTACLACHRQKTAEQARRAADERRGQLAMFSDELSEPGPEGEDR